MFLLNPSAAIRLEVDASDPQFCNRVGQTVCFANHSNLHVLPALEDKVKPKANESL